MRMTAFFVRKTEIWVFDLFFLNRTVMGIYITTQQPACLKAFKGQLVVKHQDPERFFPKRNHPGDALEFHRESL